MLEKEMGIAFSVIELGENLSGKALLGQCQKKMPLLEQHFFFPVSSVLPQHSLRPLSRQVHSLSEIELQALLQEGHTLSPRLDLSFQEAMREQNLPAYHSQVESCLDALLSWNKKLIDHEKACLFEICEGEPKTSWMDASSLSRWFLGRFSRISALMEANKGDHYSRTVREVILYIYENYADTELTADKIAEHFAVGVNQLNTILKKETGCTLWKYLIQVRMERAKYLLDSTDKKNLEISNATGYSTITYFSTAFRKCYGISPQEYRKSSGQTP